MESPYGSHVKESKKVDVDAAYFFWLSIVWRMSAVGGFGYKLPEDLEASLGNSLKNYLQVKADKGDITDIVGNCQFRYKLLHCSDYSKENEGFQNASFNGDTVDLMVGDFLLRATFDRAKEFPNPPYYGADEFFADAQINDGIGEEKVKETTIDDFTTIVKSFIAETSKLKLQQISRLLDSLWTIYVGPNPMPVELKKEFVENYLIDKIKLGVKHTDHNFALAFKKVLVDNGIVKD